MEENKKFELVASKQDIAALTINAKEIKAAVTEAIKKYSDINYSKDNIKDAKKDKADLNRVAKNLNDKRLEIQKSFMKPFDEFKKEIDETVAIIKEASKKIDDIVKAAEHDEKAKKYEEIREYYNSLNFPLVEFESIFEESMLNKTASIKSIKDKIDGIVKSIKNDLSFIDDMNETKEDKELLGSMYLRDFSLSYAISELKKIKEYRKLAAQNKEEKEAEKDEIMAEEIAKTDIDTNDFNVDDVLNMIEEEPIYTRIITIKATKEQMFKLAEFMKENNIEYKSQEN